MSSPWTTVALSEIATIRKGKKPRSMVSESVAAKPYLTADVLRGGDYIQFVPNAEASNCVELKGTEVVVLWDGAGAGDVFPSQEGILASTMATVEVIKPDLLLPKFLQLAVAGQTHILKSTCRGTTVPHVAPEVLQQLEIPVPPRRVQERIVDVMASVDTCIAGLEKQAEAARTAQSAVLGERLTMLEESSALTSLSDLIDRGTVTIGRGKVISKKDMEEDPGDFPVYSSAQNNDGKIGAFGKFMFDEELITWSIDGGGHVFYRPRHKFSVTNIGGFLRINDKRSFDCQFLSFVLQRLHGQHKFDWQSKAHPSVIRNLYDRIPCPPMALQRELVDQVASIRLVVSATKSAIDSARKFRASLVSELLSGEHEIPESYDKFLGVA